MSRIKTKTGKYILTAKLLWHIIFIMFLYGVFFLKKMNFFSETTRQNAIKYCIVPPPPPRKFASSKKQFGIYNQRDTICRLYFMYSEQ